MYRYWDFESFLVSANFMKFQHFFLIGKFYSKFHEIHNWINCQTTPNPNKCTHYLRTISTKIEIISLTTMRVSENSSDLDSGRRPESKSDEFSDTRIVVSEI